ncbi:MAG: stage V sporulation protein S [bacterium]
MNETVIDETSSNVIKISGKTNPKDAAGSLAMVLRDHGWAQMLAIGAASVNNSVKAYTIARGYVVSRGMDIIMTSAFEVTEIEGRETTRMRITVEPR